jgi:hypothetical protein
LDELRAKPERGTILRGGRVMGAKKGTVQKIGRDAETGRFISVAEAKRRRSTAIVETIRKKGK